MKRTIVGLGLTLALLWLCSLPASYADSWGGGGAGTVIAATNNFRLTLTSGTAVTTANVTGAATIYLTPYDGDTIALADSGGTFSYYTSAEVSLPLGTLTNALPYDVFAYNSSGVVTLELLAWTNGTTRATALAQTSGVWLKSGDKTRRYVGTFYTTATTTTEDSAAKRFLFNANNRIQRSIANALEPTDSWAAGAAGSFREANNSTTNRLQCVIGLSEDMISAVATSLGSQVATTGDIVTGIGVDSTSVSSSVGMYVDILTAGKIHPASSRYNGYPGIGFHFLSWLERYDGAGAVTWYGDGGQPTYVRAGITGTIVN